MFFFCKPKTVTLDAFTTRPQLVELLAPDYANKFKPKWWYDIPTKEKITLPSGISAESNTMKRCRGFKDYYSNAAIVIPLWDSFVLEFTNNGHRHSFASNESILEYQIDLQRGPEYLKEFHQLKLGSPWRFKEKSGINFLFTQAFYNFKDPTSFVMPPAIVNYRYQTATEVNFFVRKPTDDSIGRIEFEAGHPLVHLTPLTEKRLVIKTHVVSEVELKKIDPPFVFFAGKYSKNIRLGYGK
jgi:hypothetical protein